MVGVAVLELRNLAVHRLLPAPADAALNLATGAGLTARAGRPRPPTRSPSPAKAEQLRQLVTASA